MQNIIVKKIKVILKSLLGKQGISGKNNLIRNQGVLKNVRYNIVGHQNEISIGNNSRLCNVEIFMHGNGHQLLVGDNCAIMGGSIWFEDTGCKINIGDSTTIESAHLAATESGHSISIGEDCMLANGIELRTGDSHSIIDFKTNLRLNPAGNIELGKHVWLATNVIILKGVSIGDNSVIGINSVVTKPIPPNVLAVGSPAKVIRENTSWRRERI